MNEPEGQGRNRRIAWLIAALLAVSARAEAGHPSPNIPGLGPLATALVTALAAASHTIAAAAIVGLALVGGVYPHEAAAHAYLVRSSPSHRAVLARAPARVDLWFNERLEPAYSTVSVTAPSGERVDDGAAALSQGDPRRLSVTLPPLAPAEYQVRFRILSVDSHVVEGTVTFTIRGVDQRPR